MSNEYILDLKKFQKKIGILFKNQNLINQVFVHRSFLNEHKNFGLDHNERLEFLGDAVLELIVTEYLYKNYNKPEGILTNWRSALVKGESLSNIADKIGMNQLLLLSYGESKSYGKGRKLILANALEALIGAIYLDSGYEKVFNFIKKCLIVKLPKIIEKELYIDSKSKYQEFAQDKYLITPHYELIEETGPDHNKKFIIGVYLNDRLIAKGKGNSKQEAEQKAANNALKQRNNI